MKYMTSILIFSTSTFFLLIVTTEVVRSQDSALEVGVAEVDITPPVGYEQYRGPSTGIHDPLYAKAIVFEQGDESAALVVSDLISIPREMSIEIRSMISDHTGIPYQNIIVAGTHTHTGPRHHNGVNEYISRKRNGELSNSDGNSYEARLINGIVDAAFQAYDNKDAVAIESGSGYADNVSFNRRYLMKNGRVRFNPGVQNPSIVRPAGPIDPEIGFILFRDASGDNPVASLTSFANHTDTFGGTDFSADYPGYLATELRKEFGDEFISVFGMGTSGNLNHIDAMNATHQDGSVRVTQRIGETLASAVLEELQNLNRTDNPILGVRSETVFSPLQNYTEEELAWAQDEDRGAFYEERTFLQGMRARKILHLERMRSSGEAIPPTVGSTDWTLPVEVQVIQVGENAAIVGIPGEVFVELGMAIKDSSPFETTLIVELTNIGIGYVPNEDAFGEGDYETVNSRLAPGGGELMVETAIKLLNELHQRNGGITSK